MIIFVGILAFYVAWNLGANDVANSMGTSVGSKAVTLKQALIIAGILEFTGAVLFGRNVSETLATKIVNSSLFANTPQLLLMGMIAVLISVGLWMQIATSFGLPVSSSHAVVGAIAGFSGVAAGVSAVDWSYIGMISIAWVITPIVSGLIAALFYSIIKYWILDHTNSLAQLREWIPWLSMTISGVFGVIVLPPILETSLISSFPLPHHDITIVLCAIAAIILSVYSWKKLAEIPNSQSPIPHPPSPLEKQLGRFQVLSACFVAFAHGSNDVGNAIAPLAAIAYIQETGNIPESGFIIPLWILLLGGVGIVGGLAVWGKKVIATIGEGIISLQPSSGFCAELATATTILAASRWGLPVSTSHALVGAVVGIGLVKNWQSVRLHTLKSIILAWVITIPIAATLGAIIFMLIRWRFGC